MMKKYDDRYDTGIEHISDSYKKSAKEAFVRKEISDFSSMSPEMVAQLIKSWINSDDDEKK